MRYLKQIYLIWAVRNYFVAKEYWIAFFFEIVQNIFSKFTRICIKTFPNHFQTIREETNSKKN
jgi:hypothetical protein